MHSILRRLFQDGEVAVEGCKPLSLNAIRESVYRLQTVIISLGLVGGGWYNYFNNYPELLVFDVVLGVVLFANTGIFVTTQRKLLAPLPLLMLAYGVLVTQVLFATPEFIYFGAIFPVAAYLTVTHPNLSRLNFFWWSASSCLAFAVLSGFDAAVFSASLAGVCIFLEMIFFVLEQNEAELKHLATRDPLTNTLNRRAMEKMMEKAISFRERYGQPVSLIMIDIDWFKEINDVHGHGEGDSVLVNLAAFLGLRLREVDSLCRYGGEEFVLILPNTHQAQAYQLAQRLREEINRARLSDKVSVSVSCGVAEFQQNEALRSWLDRCDRALYQAKQNGRNCVEAAIWGAVA